MQKKRKKAIPFQTGFDMNDKNIFFQGKEASIIVSALSDIMSRKDWIEFAREFPEPRADNLVFWHILHKRKKLEKIWPENPERLRQFIKVNIKALKEKA